MLLRSPLVPSADRLSCITRRRSPQTVVPIHKPTLVAKRHPRSLPRLRATGPEESAAAAVGPPPPEEKAAAFEADSNGNGRDRLSVEVGSPNLNLPMRISAYRMSLGDQAFFLLAFIACTTSAAFTSLVIAAVPTLFAMKRAATSLAKLADTAREELPSTMAAIRLSGMEISDLTLELSDLSQEIADGVSKSAQAVQAAEAGIRQIGSLARRQTISMIQERANLPNMSLRPVVAGAARKTSNVVGQAKKTLMNLISGGDEYSLETGEHDTGGVEY